jgi:hypothetical protein
MSTLIRIGFMAFIAVARATSHTCFNCGCTSRFAWECPAPKKNQAQGHANHASHGQQKVVATKSGHVNCTTMEDIPEGEQVLVGMFSLNGHPIVILLDLGASQDFISKACIEKN